MVLLSEVIEKYKTEVLPRKKPSTRTIQRMQLDWWAEQIGHIPIATVTTKDINRVREILLAQTANNGHSRSNATANRYIAAIRHVFTKAVREWQYIETNPCSNIAKLRENPGRTRYLSNQERQRLLEACRGSRSKIVYPIVVTALHTGMRQGEIMALRWSDIDFEGRTITVRVTKSGHMRYVPMSEELTREFMKIRRPHGFVFDVFESGRQPAFPDGAWENARANALLDDFRFHDLRHTFATYLRKSGADLLTLAEVLGHETLDMVKRYAHADDTHRRTLVEKMVSGLDE